MTFSRHLRLSPSAIFTSKLDLALTSGVSIVVMMGLIVLHLTNTLPRADPGEAVLPKLLLLQILLNWPHFLVSYRLLYSDTENFRRFPLAAIGVPVILLAVCFGSTLPALGGDGLMSANLTISYFLWVFAALYLAWHYTGQTWGVMMIFARLGNMTFTRTERLILKGGFKVLIAWHVIWGLASLPPFPIVSIIQSPTAQVAINFAAICAALLGIWVWLSKLARSEVIDIRVLGAWSVLFMWYGVLWLTPDAFVLVQLSHALQYLIFPARIELNRPFVRNPSAAKRTGCVYAACVVGGIVVFYLPEIYLLSPTGAPTVFALLMIAVNIHHYYTDSAIWKLRNKSVRDSLFGHHT